MWILRRSALPTLDDRKRKIKGNCFGCLEAGHKIENCHAIKSCFFCKRERAHHQAACPSKLGEGPKVSESVYSATEPHDNTDSTTPPESVPTNVSGRPSSLTYLRRLCINVSWWRTYCGMHFSWIFGTIRHGSP